MKWHVYVGRTGLDIPKWLRTLNISTHKALCDWCEANNVVAPDASLMREYFDAMAPKKPKPQKPEASKKPKKKPKTSKKPEALKSPEDSKSAGTSKSSNDDADTTV